MSLLQSEQALAARDASTALRDLAIAAGEGAPEAALAGFRLHIVLPRLKVFAARILDETGRAEVLMVRDGLVNLSAENLRTIADRWELFFGCPEVPMSFMMDDHERLASARAAGRRWAALVNREDLSSTDDVFMMAKGWPFTAADALLLATIDVDAMLRQLTTCIRESGATCGLRAVLGETMNSSARDEWARLQELRNPPPTVRS